MKKDRLFENKAVAVSHNAGLFIDRAAFFINSPQRYDVEALKA